jgi:hypothetical protein
VNLELFDLAGKRLASRRDRVPAPGRQSLDVSAMLSGLRGVGWLRVTADGATEGFRVCKPGIADPAVAGSAGTSTGVARGRVGHAPAAKLAGAGAVLDTLRVDLAGYLTARIPVRDSMLAPGRLNAVELWKDPQYVPDSGTAASWRAYFERPAQLILLGHNSISTGSNALGSVIVTADGKEVQYWSTLPCYPEPPPRTLRLAYVRDGREYRDTLDLAPFWAFHDSFRTRVDSLGPGDFRAYSTWTWPGGLSVLPDRDVLEVFQADPLGGVHYHSYPQADQRSGSTNIDGPSLIFGEPDPRSGAIMIPGRTPVLTGYIADITLARREGHDLRVRMDWRPYYPQPAKLEFLNEWPADGKVRPNQSLRLESRIPPLSGFPPPGTIPPPIDKTYLEMSRKRAWEAGGFFFDFAWQMPWDGTAIDWKFPFPLADTMTFRLRVRQESYSSCDGLDESPALTFMPDPADTSVRAYEPNDSDSEAREIGKGSWHRAALDFRGPGSEDVDYFRFQGASGERVRFSLRNLDGEAVSLFQNFAGPSSGIVVERGRESSIEYGLPADGTYWFRCEGRPGRYEFRVDTAQ